MRLNGDSFDRDWYDDVRTRLVHHDFFFTACSSITSSCNPLSTGRGGRPDVRRALNWRPPCVCLPSDPGTPILHRTSTYCSGSSRNYYLGSQYLGVVFSTIDNFVKLEQFRHPNFWRSSARSSYKLGWYFCWYNEIDDRDVNIWSCGSRDWFGLGTRNSTGYRFSSLHVEYICNFQSGLGDNLIFIQETY